MAGSVYLQIKGELLTPSLPHPPRSSSTHDSPVTSTRESRGSRSRSAKYLIFMSGIFMSFSREASARLFGARPVDEARPASLMYQLLLH